VAVRIVGNLPLLEGRYTFARRVVPSLIGTATLHMLTLACALVALNAPSSIANTSARGNSHLGDTRRQLLM
jgi:hypothetical protein